jgi:hypothetical protein
MSIATYSFLNYLRQGIANNLKSTGGSRATFTVQLDVKGDETKVPADDKIVDIYGPGDIIGIDRRSVVKTDPHNRINNFESNYLAYIDFYDEDLPWRYTPDVPGGQRLTPWISLIVLAEGEFKDGKTVADQPLPFITLNNDATRSSFFPKPNQLWAWAHVHYNGDITASADTIVSDNKPDVDAALDRLGKAISQNPDCAYSRLLCPRKLLPGTSYHAFVIPSYESGRLAGRGKPAADIAAAGLKIAWQDPNPEYPYYYRWKFETGTLGDFEYLVRLLKPKVADSRIGRRVMDMTKPGANLLWKEDPDNILGGILRLGGALKVPEEALTDEEILKTEKFDQWAIKKYPDLHPFEIEIASLVNLPDDYNIDSANAANAAAATDGGLDIADDEDSDPLITPPIYGRWHAMVERVYKDRDGNRIDNNYNWVNELNLDPRFRVPAHFGTRVVQENQEDFMKAAWDQIGEVLKANNQIRYGQVAIAAGAALHAKHFASAAVTNPAKTLLLTAPLQKRVLFNSTTVFYSVKQSTLPNAVLSAPMRRILRPRGRLIARMENKMGLTDTPRLETMLVKINSGELLPAPVKIMPPALPSVETAAAQIEPDIPNALKDLLRKNPWIAWIPLVLAIILILLALIAGAAVIGLVSALAAAAVLVYLWKKMTGWIKDLQIADSLKPENQTVQSVDEIPKSPDFHLTAPGETFSPTVGGSSDSTEAVKFKNSLRDQYRLFNIVKADIPIEKPRLSLETAAISATILDSIKPEKTVPAWTWQYIVIPPWIKDQLADEGFVEAMAYPKINTPMYEALKKISDELFLPNVELIEQNSITLLETNQPFIESYMVGLNHEFSRELLWREYPTDQRGSYFRQFWDVSTILKDPALAGKSEEEKREPYYDIPKLHEWRRMSKLGGHDNRQKPGDPPRDEVVLVIRGELLKKYPTAVVYAHKAEWTIDDETHRPVTSEPRSLHLAAEGDNPEPDKKVVRTPLYSAKIDPDIYFFGFDLSVAEAKGESDPQNPTLDNAGWFFVIKERPGEPRFGLDIPSTDNEGLVTWNDLDWKKVVKEGKAVIDLDDLPAPLALPASHVFEDNTEGKGREEQFKEDKKVAWNNTMDAANLAYILYQVPMMVCVHANEMLLKKKT